MTISNRKLNSDETHNIIAAGVDHFAKLHAPIPEPDINRLISRWRLDMQTVQGLADAINEAAHNSERLHTRETFIKDLQRLMLERTLEYNKDELQLLLACVCADVVCTNYF